MTAQSTLQRVALLALTVMVSVASVSHQAKLTSHMRETRDTSADQLEGTLAEYTGSSEGGPREDEDTWSDDRQSKHFMDQYTLHYGPRQVEYGHVCEDPEEWELRYERRDGENNRHQGKVLWGDNHGGRGQHYWDYNHGHDDQDDEGVDEAGQAGSVLNHTGGPDPARVVQPIKKKKET